MTFYLNYLLFNNAYVFFFKIELFAVLKYFFSLNILFCSNFEFNAGFRNIHILTGRDKYWLIFSHFNNITLINKTCNSWKKERNVLSIYRQKYFKRIIKSKVCVFIYYFLNTYDKKKAGFCWVQFIRVNIICLKTGFAETWIDFSLGWMVRFTRRSKRGKLKGDNCYIWMVFFLNYVSFKNYS